MNNLFCFYEYDDDYGAGALILCIADWTDISKDWDGFEADYLKLNPEKERGLDYQIVPVSIDIKQYKLGFKGEIRTK